MNCINFAQLFMKNGHIWWNPLISQNISQENMKKSQYLTFVVLCLANKILSSLADLAISKVLDKETVRESNGS